MKQLTILFNGVVQRVVSLDLPRIVIGRGTAAHISLADNPFVSRQHAAILLQGGTHILEDLGGPNGTFVGEKRVRLHPLGEGDRIQLGKHSLRYEEGTPKAESLRALEPNAENTDSGGQVETWEMDPDQSGFWAEAAVESGAIVPPAPQPPAALKPFTPDPNAFTDGAHTVAASKDELNELVRRMRIKAEPHLSLSRDGRLELLPLDQLPFQIGHSPNCQLRLDGNKWFGRTAASIERQHATWYLVAISPFWSPVTVNGLKLKKKIKLTSGMTIVVAGRRFRFSMGEEE